MKWFFLNNEEYFHPAEKAKQIYIIFAVFGIIFSLIFSKNTFDLLSHLIIMQFLLHGCFLVMKWLLIFGIWNDTKDINTKIQRLQIMSKEFPEQKISKSEQDAREFGSKLDEKIQKMEEELKKDRELINSVKIET